MSNPQPPRSVADLLRRFHAMRNPGKIPDRITLNDQEAVDFILFLAQHECPEEQRRQVIAEIIDKTYQKGIAVGYKKAQEDQESGESSGDRPVTH